MSQQFQPYPPQQQPQQPSVPYTQPEMYQKSSSQPLPPYAQSGMYQQPYQQPQTPLPPMMPAPQRPPKRPRGPGRLIVGGGLVAIAFMTILAAVILHSSPSSTSPQLASTIPQATQAANQPTSVPTAIPTSAPTQQPTAIPTQTPTATVAPTSGYTALGADLGTFVTGYGQPDDHSDASSGSYHFQRYPNSNIDFLIITTDIIDGGIYTNRVEDITAQATDANGSLGWSETQAETTCAVFLPRDAVKKNKVQTTDSVDVIYFSPSLATLFPASAFTDANGNQTQAGLFDVQYLYSTPTAISSCDLQIGTQRTNG